MIRKLRMKFALTAIVSVLIVLVVLVGGINIVNYRKVAADGDAILGMLADNNGRFPEMRMPPNDMPPNENPFTGPERIESPEIAFETRYFSVVIGPDGTTEDVDTGMISAVSESDAEAYARQAYSSGRQKGFIGEYRFIVTSAPGENTLIIFCDCGPGLSNFRGFLNISIALSVISLILISAVIFLIAGKAVKPVAESYEKQKRFITDAGHEIKTPLAVIKADAEVLEMDIGEDNEWLTDIKKQTVRLTELTNDLIMLSKMEEGKNTLVREKVDLSKIAGDAAESFRAVAVTGGKDFTVNIDDNVEITADRKSVQELITILLDNAVKYCPEGKNVTFSVFRNGKNAVIRVVNDTADDIPKDELDRLFDRFYRTDVSRNSETGGHGIGLSLARAIAAANGGKISAYKKSPKTISFKVIF